MFPIEKKYNWKRYWSPNNGVINLSDDGFLYDPADSFGKYVNANLISIDQNNSTNCLILLGEPGIGKSVEIYQFYENVIKEKGIDQTLWLDLKNYMSPEQFVKDLENHPGYIAWINGKSPLYLFLDSLDEGIFSFNNFSDAFIYILSRNKEGMNSLFLRISCRTAVWPSYLESKLGYLFGAEKVKKYELCPLIKSDVVGTLKAIGINEKNFFSEINEKGVAGLAGKPLTLRMLTNVFKKEGHLPNSKVEIYNQGCSLLLEEPDESKKNQPSKIKMTLQQKIAVSERIAMATLIGGKSAILMDDIDGDDGEVSSSVLQGNEVVSGVIFPIGNKEIKEVLNTGLFSSRGDGKMGWAHQTYGEFLSAKCILDHELSWKQIKSILFQDILQNGNFRIVPQLHEVAAWLASMKPDFFDNAVLLDPEFLLLSDANAITNQQKEELTKQLLDRMSKGEIFDRWETFNFKNYRKLKHPKIAKQLEPYISDNSLGIVVRRSAIDIARACKIASLEDIFVKIALNEKENLNVRVLSIKAIGDIGSEDAKNKLKSLIILGFDNDPEDELKGTLIYVLWPKQITTKELFSLLTPPKRHNFLGSYYRFTEGQITKYISKKDLTIALEWVEKNALHDRDIEYYLDKVADLIMLKAWDFLEDNKILEVFSRIAYKRLDKYEAIIGKNSVNDKMIKSFQKLIDNDDEKRRRFIGSIVQLCIKDKEPGTRGYLFLSHGGVRLVFSKDLPWLVNWLENENNEDIQKILAYIISRIFDIKKVEDIELVNQARKNSFLEQNTGFWFDSVDLKSKKAEELRKSWLQEKEWEKKQDKNEIDEIKKVISISKIKELLKKAESGDTNSWWILNNTMCLYKHEYSEDDFCNLPGWKIIDETIKERIINTGKKFILEQDSKPEKWLGKNMIYFPAVAGYRAFKALYKKEDSFLESLSTEVWQKWAPIIIGMPLISNDPENGKLIALAYKHAPKKIIDTLDVLIDEDDKQHHGLFIIDLLSGCVDKNLSEFLLAKSSKEDFSPNSIQDILNFLLKHKIETAKNYAKSLIKIPLSTRDPKEKELSLIGASSLLWNADSRDWEYIWKLVQKDNNFGRSLIEKAHYYPSSRSGVLQRLSEAQLAELYIWLMKEFPPEKYFQPSGVHTVTPEISIGEWRDSVLRNLMDKGTPESVIKVNYVASELPQYKWIREFSLIETKRIALQKSWQPVQVDQILKLTENSQLRIINSPDELVDLILDSIENLENILQKGNQPQAIHLWNEKTKGVKPKSGSKKKILTLYSPKKETRLSDEIRIHLANELPKLIIGREVEVKGNKTDLYISTFIKNKLGEQADIVNLTIEVKGCWNKEIDTSMETQLIKKYLINTESTKGIYLVGWFMCDSWNDKENSQYKNTAKITIEEAKEKYKTQAKELSSKYNLRVEAVVLDCRL